MADYRDLLRRAIDALPENSGANRRAVYEKARSALVAQLRAIDPPLPAREITTHRLNLEDCIREVEQEATDRLLGRFRAVEEAPVVAPAESEPEIAVAEDFHPEPSVTDRPYMETAASASEGDAVPEVGQPEYDVAPHQEIAPKEVPEPEVVMDVEPEVPFEAEANSAEQVLDETDRVEPAPEPDWMPVEAAVQVDLPEDDNQSEPEDERLHAQATGPVAEDVVENSFPQEMEPVSSAPAPAPGSIEEIIALAQQSAGTSHVEAPEPETVNPSVDEEEPSVVALPLRGPVEPAQRDDGHHFIASSHYDEPKTDVPLVDLHGQPLRSDEPVIDRASPEAIIGEAMSSVREVELEPQPLPDPQLSDAQVAIDRAIAALDREARGEGEATSAPGDGAQSETSEAASEAEETEKSGGFGAVTMFLVIAVLLLGGGGAAGYWAWREGYIDLNSVFAQTETPASVDVASSEEPVVPPESTDPSNTTPEVPSANGGVNGAAMPGEELPFVETETPVTGETEPSVSFTDDRLPTEAEPRINGSTEEPGEEAIEIASGGPQSLLLEEQSGGTTGAVPYSGSVEWSRGSDELGHPTIVAQATIPARNLDVRVLIRRNADGNLPASHLMEINFNVAESFVGGSIANLPGVLLKDEELVQGQPLTGASARIVGNSFLFALSSASDRDVVNNEALLRERGWLDLAMVYGTGRRAILTLEKGDVGGAIFDEVMTAWDQLASAQ